MDLATYIKYLESEQQDRENPSSYQESAYYERCRIEANLLGVIISNLKELDELTHFTVK